MRNQQCPECRYPLYRQNHPYVGVVRFCRMSCVAKWHEAHGHPFFQRDEVPATGDRRRAA